MNARRAAGSEQYQWPPTEVLFWAQVKVEWALAAVLLPGAGPELEKHVERCTAALTVTKYYPVQAFDSVGQ